DLARAADLVQAARQHDAEAAPCAICSVERHAAVAAYYVAAGELDIAAHYTEQALQLAQSVQNRLGQARAWHVQGQIHGARGETAEAETHLSDAAAIFRALDNQYDLAQTLRTWGNLPADSAAVREGRRARRQEARALLAHFQASVRLLLVE
ncbi:MAG: hypothetical protein ACREQ3_23910, partial [Candidatus Binatia bacterium]